MVRRGGGLFYDPSGSAELGCRIVIVLLNGGIVQLLVDDGPNMFVNIAKAGGFLLAEIPRNKGSQHNSSMVKQSRVTIHSLFISILCSVMLK